MGMLDMIMEAVSPIPDKDFVTAMNAIDREDDRKFYSSMASMGNYASHDHSKDKTNRKISIDQFVNEIDTNAIVREQMNASDPAYVDPETEKWNRYFETLENDLNAIPVIDRMGDDPDLNADNTQNIIDETDPEQNTLPVDPLDDSAVPQTSDGDDYTNVVETE